MPTSDGLNSTSGTENLSDSMESIFKDEKKKKTPRHQEKKNR